MISFYELIESITMSILSYRGFDRPLVGVSYFWVLVLSITITLIARKFFNLPLFATCLIIVIPPLFGVYGGSVGFGVLLSSVIIFSCMFQHSQINKFGISLPLKFSTKFINYLFLLLLIISIHGYFTYSSNLETFFIFRHLVSFFGLFFIALSSYMVAYLFSTEDAKSFDKIMNGIWILVIILTLLILIRFAIFSPFFRHPYGELAVFSEPTFYVVTCFPFFVYKLATSTHHKQLQLLIALLLMSFIIRSTTLLIATILVYLSLKFRLSKKIFYYLAFVLTIFIIYIANFEFNQITHTPHCDSCLSDGSANPFTYMIYRFFDLFGSVSVDTNLSILFYKKEWHEAFYNLINTNGLGIGFQQTGVHGFKSFITDIIFQKHPNMIIGYESVTVAPKLISEFGIIGIGFLLVYLKYFFKSFTLVRQYFQHGLSKITHKELLFHIFNLTFFIILFIRGYGYFSSSIFFLIIFISYFSFIRKTPLGTKIR
jgi:hypothetical protein